VADEPALVHGVARLDAAAGPLAIAIGVFDGLHRGHRYLLRGLVRTASRWGARPAVITFDHHPDEVLRGSAPPLLLDPDERLQRLGQAGVEVVVIEHFDERLRTTPYDVFVRRIVDHGRLAGFVMTPEAAFGFERRGTPAALAELGREMKPPFQVALVPPFTLDGRPVSSSAIRAAIGNGDLAQARRLLGRSHAVVGDLRDGRLSFPMPVALPPNGRYDSLVSRFPATTRESAVRRMVRVVDDDLAIEGRGASGSTRLRAAFRSRIDDR
jgi:riboflavin kinase/FMN adenylyltransferase